VLKVKLLGQFNAEFHGMAVDIPLRPYQALFAHLVLTAGIEHRREHLVAKIWPERERDQARKYLRRGLMFIGRGFKAAGANTDDYIVGKGDKLILGFNPRASYWLDVQEIEHVLQRVNPPTADLLEAASLYEGDLLPGFERADNVDDWVGLYRTRMKHTFDRLMTQLTARLRDEGRFGDLIQAGQHWATHGNAVEQAYREMMIGHHALGDRAGVLGTYDELCLVFKDRYGTVPSDETEALLKQVLDGTYSLKPSGSPGHLSGRPPLPPTNLPVPHSPLVGREADLSQVMTLLDSPACRLITLMGPGGIGKTRLAIEAATRAREGVGERDSKSGARQASHPNQAPTDTGPQAASADTYADGVFMASLQSVTTTQALVVGLADAVRLPTYGQDAPRAKLIDFLREKHMLVALDNFEQLLRDGVDGASLVAEIMSTAPNIKLLVTSRERLHLTDEHIVELDGLDYPDLVPEPLGLVPDPASSSRKALEGYTSVQLFLQAARRIYSRFNFAAEQAGVARICHLTQGMPLALELAAAWVRALACSEIAIRIETNLDALAVTDPKLPERHRSVRAVINYSWQLLSQTERNAFAALSVFRGGFDLDAATVVAQTGTSTLFSLVDKSLIRRTSMPSGRYEMHELVRVFGEEKLAAAEDEDWRDTTVHARMARYYRDFAQAHSKDYAVLEPEWANFLAALRVAQARAVHESREWSIVTECVDALEGAWTVRGRFTDARQGYALAADAARAMGDEGTLARTLRRLGRMCIEQSDYDEAEQHLALALDISQRIGDEWEGARIQFCQALIATERANHTEAARLLMDSSETLHQFGDEAGTADALYTLSRLFYRKLEDDEAAKYAGQSLTLHEALGNTTGAASAHRMLGLVASAKGQHALALEHGKQAIDAFQSLSDQAELPFAQYDFAQMCRLAGDLEEAQKQATRAFEQFRYMGIRKMQIHALGLLSFVDYDWGHFDSAITRAQWGLSLCEALQDDWSSIYLRVTLGRALMKQNRPSEAADVWTKALAISESLHHPSATQFREWLSEIKGASNN